MDKSKRKPGRPARTIHEVLLHQREPPPRALPQRRKIIPWGQRILDAWEQGRIGGYWAGMIRALELTTLSDEEQEQIIKTIYHELGGTYDERSDANE